VKWCKIQEDNGIVNVVEIIIKMAKSYRYCINCKDEVEFTWTDGDPLKYRKDKDFTPKGWYCCTCDWKLDGRKVKHMEKKIDLKRERCELILKIQGDTARLNEVKRLLLK
jgi:hypothetical protein